MDINDSVFTRNELAAFEMRSLYSSYGYRQYRMSRFEEYDLYAKNKDFLISDGVITFTNANGKLMALKPDVTMSIIKNFDDTAGTNQKLYYHENVYRTTGDESGFREIMQTGVECIGNIGLSEVCEVIILAARSLYSINRDYVLDISHMGIVTGLIDSLGLSAAKKEELLECIGQKNIAEIRHLCGKYDIGDDMRDKLEGIVGVCGDMGDVLRKIKPYIINEYMQSAYDELCDISEAIFKAGYQKNIHFDFSVINNMKYYNGVVFKGFIEGVPAGVLSGGRYDKLMERVDKKAGAIGFAVYLNLLDSVSDDSVSDDSAGYINVALPKGRLGEKVYNMFDKAGFSCPEILEDNRKLIFENKENHIRFFWVKPSDVAIYVERGAADIGVAGKDILLEYTPDVYELLDLKMGKCRMAVAAKKGFADDTRKTLRVATKFVNIASHFYSEKCRDIDIIKLNGSIELAPILDLSDVIVDIVETGTTLKENDLEPIETILPISARLISNISSYKFKKELIEKIKAGLAEQVEND